MADISMCSGAGCTAKNKCHRYTANKGFRQSYFGTPPGKNEKCEYFWDNVDWNDEIPSKKNNYNWPDVDS